MSKAILPVLVAMFLCTYQDSVQAAPVEAVATDNTVVAPAGVQSVAALAVASDRVVRVAHCSINRQCNRNCRRTNGYSSGGSNARGGLPGGRRYYNGRYFGNFNNRFYGPQYGYF